MAPTLVERLRAPIGPAPFFALFALGLVPAAAFAALGAMFLARTYESASYDRIVAEQQAKGGVFASAVADDFHSYKLALYKARRPKVVAIGSSRTMEFDARSFTQPFATLGGAARSIEEGERLLGELKAIGPMPEVVLLGLDYWWFAPGYRSPTDKPKEALLGSTADEQKQALERYLGRDFFPASWITSKKIGLRDFVSIALHGRQPEPPLPRTYGLSALLNLHGFAPDGHYRYFGSLFGMHEEPDRQFKESISLIRGGKTRFLFAAHPSDETFARYQALVEGFERAGSHVITFTPPVATPVLAENAAQGEKLGYIGETLARFKSGRGPYFEFHDPRTFGSSDCEMLDGYHGGEVAYLRMLKVMAEADHTLGERVDLDYVRRTIEREKGRGMADGPDFAPKYKEVDMLGLGCPR